MVLNFDFNQGQFFFAGLGLITIWLVALTVLVVQMLSHYRNLTKNIAKKDLKSVLDDLLKQSGEQTKTIKKITDQIKVLEDDSLGYLQKMGFLRFNPFADTGGDQSFILSLLDDQDNGILVSSLHSRGTTRIYAKQVKAGKGKGFALSEEEKKVISQAKKLKQS